jgi:hypothetical protein
VSATACGRHRRESGGKDSGNDRQDANMRKLILLVIAVCTCTGCLSVSLKNHTEREIRAVGRYREEAALECLAVIAENPDNLPPFANVADGVVQVQESLNISATTLFARSATALGFSQQTILPSLARSPKVQWNLAPVADYTQMEALRCACRWVVYGPQDACDPCASILADPQTDPSPGPHFGVAERLAKLPTDWLQVSHGIVPPTRARFRAHFGDTWVWIYPEDMPVLQEFILVLLDISTLNVGQAPQNPTEAPKVLVHLTVTQKTEDTPHMYDLSEVSDQSLAKIIRGAADPNALSAEEMKKRIETLRHNLDGATTLPDEVYLATLADRLRDPANPKDDDKAVAERSAKAKAIAERARQPQAFDLNPPLEAKLQVGNLNSMEIKGFLDKHNDLTFSREHSLSPGNKVYIGKRSEFIKALATPYPQFAIKDAKTSQSALDKIADRVQVPVNSINLYDFSRASGLADAGLTTAQIQALRSSADLEQRFVGTEDDFIAKLGAVLEKGKAPAADKRVLKKAADSAKVPINFLYSKELSFDEERVIRPEYLELIRSRIQAAPRGQPVAISWDEWLVYSYPYHGGRSNVRPDGSVVAPTPTPAINRPAIREPLRDLLGPMPEPDEIKLMQN